MKKLVLIAASALFALGLCLGSAQAAEAPKGPKPVTNFGKKGVVTFDHAKHKDVKCKDCHHNEADGKYKCGECHGEKDGKAPKFEAAAHAKDKGVCFGCHRAENAKNKLKCADCHAK